MSFRQITFFAVFALSTLLLSGTQATLLAQSINCELYFECANVGDRAALNDNRTTCRVNAGASGFRAGIYLTVDLLMTGAGPPISSAVECGLNPSYVSCFNPFVEHACIGVGGLIAPME